MILRGAMSEYYIGAYSFDGRNAIEHHGILGQKWGVRRYQNEDGTLTDAGKQRLSRWREKELNTLDTVYAKKYGGDSLDRRISKLGDKFHELDDKGADLGKMLRVADKFNKATAEKAMLEARKKLESDYIRNATLDDISKEKKALGKAAVKSIALTAASIMFAPASGFLYVNITDAPAVKTNHRVKEMDKRTHNNG